MRTLKTIAIDIDDVVASTSDAVRVWANQLLGINLQPSDYHMQGAEYWRYYDIVWEKHGVSDSLDLHACFENFNDDQSSVATLENVRQHILNLKESYKVIFITARPLIQKEATRRWLDENIDSEIPLYLSANPFFNQTAQSKGEICAELGVDLLIDDHIDNCQSARQYGVEAILFGDYGWNFNAPSDLRRCSNWLEVGDYFSSLQNSELEDFGQSRVDGYGGDK